jgi:hypothetical protein
MLIGNTRIGGIGSLSVKNTYDPDALAYLTAVEAADGQALENSVKIAINTFVVGCKTDGNWSAIRASCILAGARTLSGALVPLAGNAPTNTNFVSGDYSRKTGLLGNGSSKTLLTFYQNTDSIFATSDRHLSCYVTSAPTTSATLKTFIGGYTIGARQHLSKFSSGTPNDDLSYRLQSNSGFLAYAQGLTTGFKGVTRTATDGLFIAVRSSGTTTTTSNPTGTSLGGYLNVFAGATATNLTTAWTDARMSFYSMGRNIDLALLDTRITTLMTTLNALL